MLLFLSLSRKLLMTLRQGRELVHQVDDLNSDDKDDESTKEIYLLMVNMKNEKWI